MTRIAYVNGAYVHHRDGCVHIEDRGYQFSDGVYEVIEIYKGKLVEERRHMQRLERSLREIRMAIPMSAAALGHVLRETVRRNRARYGFVYLQVSRGVAPRDHGFPQNGCDPAVVVTVRPKNKDHARTAAATGIKVITVPETRWKRPDIKSVSLLANVLARQQAGQAGAKEAWFVDENGFITEGAAANAWIIDNGGALITHPAQQGILHGITRAVLLDLARREGMSVEERPFTLKEAYEAREAFLTATTSVVMPVVQIDERIIANGEIGSIAGRLGALFADAVELS